MSSIINIAERVNVNAEKSLEICNQLSTITKDYDFFVPIDQNLLYPIKDVSNISSVESNAKSCVRDVKMIMKLNEQALKELIEIRNKVSR